MKGLIKLWLLSAVLALCFFWGGLASSAFASLANSNFNEGFTGWTGDLIYTNYYEDGSFEDISVTVSPTDYSENFIRVGSGVTLKTTDLHWGVLISQNFYVPDNAATLSFNIEWIPTSSDFDLAQSVLTASLDDITLFDCNSENGFISVNISSLAGTSSRLDFGLKDMDMFGDTLTIKNIQISESPASPVPIPGSLPLMAAGLLGLGLFRFWRNN